MSNSYPFKIFATKNIAEDDLFKEFINNSQEQNISVSKAVIDIIENIKNNGDKSIIEYCNKFDDAKFESSQDFIVKKEEINKAYKNIDNNLLNSLKQAKKRILAYHKKQMPKNLYYRDKSGVKLGNIWKPIERVAVYAPGGTASYPSSVLMSAIPAIVAGSKDIALFTPAKKGTINDSIIVAADLCNIKNIFKIGGVQAIAGACYGSEAINKFDKIVGPGNNFVATAKRMLFGKIGIDMIAGPTDLTIIAEFQEGKNNSSNLCNPEWVAIDALSQLEHGENSKIFIITNEYKFALKIADSLIENAKKMPRFSIIEQSLKNSAIIVVENINKAPEIVNVIAPEHLQIIANNAEKIASKINNAGAIFLGRYSPEAIGDYIAGPSHTLPTEGSSRFSSGLSVFDFLKRVSLISCNKNSFNKIAKYGVEIARAEGLYAHQLSLEIRLNKKQNENHKS
ncbi:MAG: histidinol dehydrogenase [Rickettsiales bacterium]|nr:histidinol dehydrogenase [Rickettsiales bacterium]